MVLGEKETQWGGHRMNRKGKKLAQAKERVRCVHKSKSFELRSNVIEIVS